MTQLPAPPAEPRHGGGAGRRGRGQWVAYPLRLVLDAEAYADADTKIYGKVKALSKNRFCEASVEKIAAYVGVAESTAEKGLGRLSRPAPTDGVTELGRRQRSHKGSGNGRTNERWCRPLDDGERYVYAPVLAADTLRGTLHRLYLFLRYTQVVEKRQLTLAEMAWVLRHRTGKHAGQALAEAVVSKLLDELAALGWITLDRRAGYRGRHLITVHDDPVRPVTEPETTPDPEGGAAPDLEGGALAYKEDRGIERLEDAQVGGGIRRRRPTATSARDERSTAVDTFGRRTGLDLTPAAWRTVHTVLDPVRHELAALTGWEWERLVAEVLRHLGTGATPDRLADRIARRYATMRTTDPTTGPGIRSIARWLIGAALIRHGCTDPRCETGVIWSSDPDDHEAGADCRTCAYTREAEQARTQRDAELEERLQQMAAERAHTPRQEPPTPRPAPEPPGPPDAPSPAPGAPYRHGWRTVITPHTTQVTTGDRHSPCPTCHAPPGKPCTTPRGRPRTTTHQARPTAA